MNIIIRQEKETDYKAVFHTIKMAFTQLKFSDHKEHFLVERLRKSYAFVPELSLVAEYKDEIIGHILLTKVTINNNGKRNNSLALAPVSVLPEFQRQGIGRMLIKNAHRIAEQMKYQSIVLLGHPEYYPKFGYVQADHFGIEIPYKVPKENCMVIELTKNGLKNVRGIVEYPKEFNEG